MRQWVVLLVSVTTVVGGIPVRARATSGDDITAPHRHYLLRANPEDADAIAARHGLWIERRDETGSPLYYVGSGKDPILLTAEVTADTAVVSFEEDRTLAVSESDPAQAPIADPATTSDPATEPTTTTTEPVTTTSTSTDPAATTTTTPTDPAATTTTTTDPAATTTTTSTDPAASTTTTSTDPAATTTTTSTDPAATTTTTSTDPGATTTTTSTDQTPTTTTTSTDPALDTTRDVPPEPLPTTAGLPDSTPTDYYGTNVWRGFVFQPAATIIRNDDAHRDFATGAGVVAVIDSGIDINHPALQGVFVPGYDFLAETTAITSDTATLQQSTASILEYTSPDSTMDPLTIAQLNQSTAAILEQSTAAILEGTPLPSGFGHGTMVSGLVHLVAPTAKIMPLRVFRADGTGDIYDVIRAIYYAVDHGATVINMSFSLTDWSDELVRALNYAANHRVVCVASAGNAGKETLVFPSGLRTVIGVGSTDIQDRRSTFSNFGKAVVRLSAPGEGLVTTFPGAHYALVSGTSFSTALVSGAASLVLQRDPTMDPEDVDDALTRANRPRYGALAGDLRLDLYYALSRVRRPDLN
jgi:Subtilase family